MRMKGGVIVSYKDRIDPTDPKNFPVKEPYHNTALQTGLSKNGNKDINRFLNLSLALYNLPKVSLKDGEAVNQRIAEFFRICLDAHLKPTVAGLALALDTPRQTLNAINTGNFGNTGGLRNLPELTTSSIKRAYIVMENLWENYAVNGQINPVTAIFLGKNNFGYRDQVDYVVNSGEATDSIDSATIRKRYLSDSDSATLDSPDSAPTLPDYDTDPGKDSRLD